MTQIQYEAKKTRIKQDYNLGGITWEECQEGLEKLLERFIGAAPKSYR